MYEDMKTKACHNYRALADAFRVSEDTARKEVTKLLRKQRANPDRPGKPVK